MNDKPRSSGNWTEARYNTFVKNALRAAHRRWGPRNEAKKLAWIKRGVYKCAMCLKEGPATLPPLEGRKRRRNNAAIDHIEPVIDPYVGFVDWNTVVERMFVEIDKYQILCWECHTKVTKEERDIQTERKREEKLCQQKPK